MLHDSSVTSNPNLFFSYKVLYLDQNLKRIEVSKILQHNRQLGRGRILQLLSPFNVQDHRKERDTRIHVSLVLLLREILVIIRNHQRLHSSLRSFSRFPNHFNRFMVF